MKRWQALSAAPLAPWNPDLPTQAPLLPLPVAGWLATMGDHVPLAVCPYAALHHRSQILNSLDCSQPALPGHSPAFPGFLLYILALSCHPPQTLHHRLLLPAQTIHSTKSLAIGSLFHLPLSTSPLSLTHILHRLARTNERFSSPNNLTHVFPFFQARPSTYTSGTVDYRRPTSYLPSSISPRPHSTLLTRRIGISYLLSQ